MMKVNTMQYTCAHMYSRLNIVLFITLTFPILWRRFKHANGSHNACNPTPLLYTQLAVLAITYSYSSTKDSSSQYSRRSLPSSRRLAGHFKHSSRVTQEAEDHTDAEAIQEAHSGLSHVMKFYLLHGEVAIGLSLANFCRSVKWKCLTAASSARPKEGPAISWTTIP